MPSKYTVHDMEDAVALAMREGTKPAARKMGVPESTIRAWKKRPEIATKVHINMHERLLKEPSIKSPIAMQLQHVEIPETDYTIKGNHQTKTGYSTAALMSTVSDVLSERTAEVEHLKKEIALLRQVVAHYIGGGAA